MSKQSEAVKRCQRVKSTMLREYRAHKGCARCGERHIAVLDFHHRPGETKSPKLNARWKLNGEPRLGGPRWGEMSYAEILAEVAKCDVLCSNCHRKETLHHNMEFPVQRDHRDRRAFKDALYTI